MGASVKGLLLYTHDGHDAQNEGRYYAITAAVSVAFLAAAKTREVGVVAHNCLTVKWLDNGSGSQFERN